MFDIAKVRADFPMLCNHPDLVYFDNGATTFKPQCVIDAVTHYYTHTTANIHRGDYPLSYEVSEQYDQVRKQVADFLHCASKEVVFTHGDTDSLNQVAYSFGGSVLQKGDVILTTESEHASSILPWFRIAKEKGVTVAYVPLTQEGQITIENYQQALTPEVKIVVTTHVSNVLGHINPITEMAQRIHAQGGYLIVDGAQSVPHMPIDVQALDCDFLTFSAHKMLGPSGIGILYGKQKLLDAMEPLYLGGGANARFDRCGMLILKESPEKFEAGTPPIEAVLGFGAAVSYLNSLGMETVQAYEQALHQYLLQRLATLDNVIVYNPLAETGIVALNVKGVFAQDAAGYLGSRKIAVRAGNHCAKILKNVIGTDETIRASLAFYNTREEVDCFIEAVRDTTIENCIGMFL